MPRICLASGTGVETLADRAEALEGEPLLSDEEVLRRLAENPEIRGRAEELLKRVQNGGLGPSLKPEELADFLREHG